MNASAVDPRPPFNLVRWFATLAFVCIAAVSAVSSWLLSGFLKQELMNRDAEISRAWVESIARINNPAPFFTDPAPGPGERRLAEFINHVASLPDVLRVNAYSREKRVLWSTDRKLIGREFPEDVELAEALEGNVAVLVGETAEYDLRKPDQRFSLGDKYFVELSLPVRALPDGPVIGVVEIYRPADTLLQSIRRATLLVWAGGAAGGALVFAALFWLIRRASHTIAAQQQRLLETESLAVVGEMSTVVAHGIRNPLAGIRSSAELLATDIGLTPANAAAREFALDITREVDRLEQWVRGLLTYAQPVSGPMEDVSLGEVVTSCLKGFARDFERLGIAASSDLPPGLPPVRGNRALIGEVLNNLVSNAVDAMPGGGTLRVSAQSLARRGRLRVAIQDTGVGIAPERLHDVLAPFYTTKGKGVGLGLPLAQRILRRCGGKLEIESSLGVGTTVRLELGVAS